jgi:signal transduction histidine kinase/streptogramin lyase
MLSFPSRFWIFLAFHVCCASFCQAANTPVPTEFTAREWHESDGLPSEEVDTLALDDRGYLWVASPGKFARFDGTSFETAKIPPEVALRSMVFGEDAAHPGSRGLIAPLVAVENTVRNNQAGPAGYYVYSGGAFRFHPEAELNGNVVRTIFNADDGALWLGCEDGTLLRRRGKQTQIFPVPPAARGKKFPSFTAGRDGQVWVLINEFVGRFNGSQWEPVFTGAVASGLRLVSSRSGGPWLITHNAVQRWNGTSFTPVAQIDEQIGANYIQTAIEDRHGHLWFGTRSHGLYRVVGEHVLPVPISHADICALQEDTDGNIWVGTNGGGLVRLKTKTFWLYDKAAGLSDDFSHSVAEDRDGVIWLANRDGGVARIQNGVVDPISKRANWRSFSAKSVFPASDGGVWVTTGLGVYRTRPDNPESIMRVSAMSDIRGVRVTFVARNGDYWLALDPDKIVRWRDGQATYFGAENGFDGREIRAITEDSSGAIWIGAAEGKLFRSHDNGFERVPLPPGEDYGLLQALWFEADGTLLIGTTRRGVLFLPPGGPGKSRLLTTKQGLPNGDVSSILRDDAGRYWFASRGGIFSIQGEQLRDFAHGKIKRVHTVVIGKDYGLPQLSGLGRTQPSGWKARDGVLWFATRKGVVRVDPALTPETSGPAPATLVEIACDGVPQPAADELTIQSTVRKIEIRFSVLSLSVPEQTVVRYRLEGFDNDWITPGQARVATYPRLTPGTYTLFIQVSDGAETWMDQPQLLTIRVVPPWWQTWWAQLGYLLTLVLSVAVLVRFWSYRRLRRRLEHSEREQALERERTRIARNIHDDLGASLTRISLITQSAQHKNPALAAEFEEIFESVRTSTRSMDEIVWAVNPRWDDVENLVSYLGNYAQKFLGAAGIRRQLNLPSTLPSIKLPSQARHNLFLCCKEALNNIVKHAGAKEVMLTVTADEFELRIEIADDGRGFAASDRTPSTERVASGNGLQNMRDRMAEMAGTFEISSRPRGGTLVVFSVKFPLPSKLENRLADNSAPLGF